MIIQSNTQLASNLLASTQTRPQKSAARASTETSEAKTAEALADQRLVTNQNLASAVSPLADNAAALAAIQSVRKQFLAQPNVALLAQANQLPQNALQLLQ